MTALRSWKTYLFELRFHPDIKILELKGSSQVQIKTLEITHSTAIVRTSASNEFTLRETNHSMRLRAASEDECKAFMVSRWMAIQKEQGGANILTTFIHYCWIQVVNMLLLGDTGSMLWVSIRFVA